MPANSLGEISARQTITRPFDEKVHSSSAAAAKRKMHFSCPMLHLGIYGVTRQLPRQMSDVAATFRFSDNLTSTEFRNYLVRAAPLQNASQWYLSVSRYMQFKN